MAEVMSFIGPTCITEEKYTNSRHSTPSSMLSEQKTSKLSIS